MDTLDESARRDLLGHARAAIARAIGVEDRPRGAPPMPAEALRAGVFVTLRIGGRLRGCIGYSEPEFTLADAVERCAVSAAISDPRFPSLTPQEFAESDLEISVLGSIEPVGHISEIVIGRHGLIAESGRHRGLLLPQVAVEWGWNAAELAAETCLKAGLRRDAWQDGARLLKFEAEVFGERNRRLGE